MKKVNEIDIKINKAVVTSITIELDMETGKPKFTVQGVLLTDRNRQVSTFMYYTNEWNKAKNLDIPVEGNKNAAELFKMLTPIIYKKINGEFLEIEAPKKTSLSDLDDLPF